MSFTFSTFQALLLPMILVFAYFGYRRGSWLEIGITGGMAMVVLLTVFFPAQLLGFINRVIVNIPRVLGLLVGNANAQPLPEDLVFGNPSSGQFLLARTVLFFLLAFLVYSRKYGWSKPPKTNTDRILGLLLGGFTGLLWFVALNDFLNALRALRNNPVIPPEGTTITVPTVSDVAGLVALVPTIAVVLLIVLAVLAVRRLPNLWK
jgi:uncharacterized membrane protein required for colicin V production